MNGFNVIFYTIANLIKIGRTLSVIHFHLTNVLSNFLVLGLAKEIFGLMILQSFHKTLIAKRKEKMKMTKRNMKMKMKKKKMKKTMKTTIPKNMKRKMKRKMKIMKIMKIFKMKMSEM